MNSFLDKTNGPMMTFFDLIYKWLILNILFILFTCIGLVVFGIVPSWLTLHQMIKRVIKENEEGIKYFKEYKKLFIENLIPGSIFLLFIVIVGGITVLDGIFIYDKYLGVDELTIVGVIISIGGIFLAYVVFGMISILGTIWAYYDRFKALEALKFSFFTVLSSPIYVLSSLIVFSLGYILFSILVSAAPFLGFSLPVTGVVLFYGKYYSRIFLIKKADGNSYYNFRYIQDVSKFLDVLNSVLPMETMFVKKDQLMTLLHQEQNDFRNSIVVLDSTKQVVAFVVISNSAQTAIVEVIVVKEGSQRMGIGKNMIQLIKDSKEYNRIVINTNKKELHDAFERVSTLRLFCKNIKCKEVEKDQFILNV